MNTVFGEKPDDYQPKEPTFQRTARRLPMGTMSFAKDGTTVSGIYDTGAEVCVLSTRVALEKALSQDSLQHVPAAAGRAEIIAIAADIQAARHSVATGPAAASRS